MDVFAAISDPTRRRVLELLNGRERSAGELVDAFPHLTQPAVSRHLRVLREAGLVVVRQDEQRRMYSLRGQGFSELDRWLAHYRSFWSQKLDDLEAHLDRVAAEARARPPRRKGRKA
jgi:DNA-binding transcriptional ArsR family regulator